MITKKIIHDRIIYKAPGGEFHNPHGPAIRYTSDEYKFYLNSKLQNIVGPSRLNFITRSPLYYINNIYTANMIKII